MVVLGACSIFATRNFISARRDGFNEVVERRKSGFHGEKKDNFLEYGKCVDFKNVKMGDTCFGV